jgi:hypothetical protein
VGREPGMGGRIVVIRLCTVSRNGGGTVDVSQVSNCEFCELDDGRDEPGQFLEELRRVEPVMEERKEIVEESAVFGGSGISRTTAKDGTSGSCALSPSDQ